MLKNNKANDALIMLCYTCAFGAFGAFFRWLQMQVARDTETGMINPSILNILLPLLIVAAAVVLWLRTRKLTDDQTVFPTGMSEALRGLSILYIIFAWIIAALAVLGGSRIPYMIFLYPNDFESKDRLLEYLDAYNEGRPVEEQVVYTDLAASISEMTGSIIDGITFVLIAFAAVSLVVSLIMICIITYTSVLERTKEIGILKSLGARKKDIARVMTIMAEKNVKNA